MKRTLIMFLFVFSCLTCFAPTNNVLIIAAGVECIGPKNNYIDLMEAISKYESNNIDSAYNVKENACGRLQIRQCRVEHYNRLTGRNFTLQDMFNFEKAKEVFLYFAQGKTLEHAAKQWNGSGPKTIEYWEHIKALLKI